MDSTTQRNPRRLTRLPASFPPEKWDNRFRVQAEWTRTIRQRLYQKAKINHAHRVLEVGCGTGVLTSEMRQFHHGWTYGIDLSPDLLSIAHTRDTNKRYILGDGNDLPFRSESFDLVFCHYFLLWVNQPEQVLKEMKRVMHKNHPILALAEPDYGGRIDYPRALVELGALEILGLEKQGANPLMGRELAGLFLDAGLINVETGILAGEWKHPAKNNNGDSEWDMLELDLADLASVDQLRQLKEIDLQAWQNGERILFVPTFYAIGWVP
jgi:SAM-dependent methyltransferase